MISPNIRPSITEYSKISELVLHLRQEGVEDAQMAKRLSQIGAVDLDMLEVVLRVI